MNFNWVQADIDTHDYKICFHDDHSSVVSSENRAVDANSSFGLAHVDPNNQTVCTNCHVLQTLPHVPNPRCSSCDTVLADKAGACTGGSHFSNEEQAAKRQKIAAE